MMTERVGAENEPMVTPEIPDVLGEITIVTQRHDEYDNRKPEDRNNIQDDELQYGHLKPEGRDHATKIARARVRKIISGCRDVNKLVFAVNASNTVWIDGLQEKDDDTKTTLGQRAIETGEQIYNVIITELQLLGMTKEEAESHVINTWVNPETGKPVLRGKEPNVTWDQGIYNRTAYGVEPSGVRQDNNLQESRIFNQAPGYVQALVEKNNGRGEGFWEDLNDDVLGEVRLEENPKSEGPEELAARVDFTERAEIRLAEKIRKETPELQVVFFNVSHGETIEPHAARSVGVKKGAFSAGFSSGYSTTVYNDGRKVTRFPSGEEIVR